MKFAIYTSTANRCLLVSILISAVPLIAGTVYTYENVPPV